MGVRVVDAMTRAICWTAGVVNGLVTGLRGHDIEAAWTRGGGNCGEPIGELRAALLGRHRRQIVRALGEPPTASIGFGISVRSCGAPPVTYWQAPTWYYPISAKRRQAIAIRFVGHRARGVDFIGVGSPDC